MVKVKDSGAWLQDGNIDVDKWLLQLNARAYLPDVSLVHNACTLSELAGREQATDIGISCLQLGLQMADILADLEVDQETLAAAIVYESVHYAELSCDDVEEQLGAPVAKLVKGIENMSAIGHFQVLHKYQQNKQKLDNVRKMLLAMVDDVRVVLIKLAERLCILRNAGQLPEALAQDVATEVMNIYAPLANRLGIGALKWEMEDLAFRYLHPEDYKAIAKGLRSKRLDRDRYVNMIVDTLNHELTQLGIKHFAVYGRAKHIHSIYRKMLRKNVSLDEVYDATAVRVLVDDKDACYQVLGLVHSLWDQIPIEFDDYIHHPKPNGYQSLHTAVMGPEQRAFEVQIRTFEMHDFAEMGVAAHWKYKEGATHAKESHERKIEWLRSVMAWHREMAANEGVSEAIESEFLEDRVYVFTPEGDVLDLPQGATPLDFAYHVHSQVGHRCRGAKINDHIVPLTTLLRTGDKVTILTAKEARPSRDWLNPHLNYLKTSRAKAKVLHWFKMQDFEKNLQEGRDILDKELKNLGISGDGLEEIAKTYQFKRTDDLLAALGRGDLKLSQIIHRLHPADSADKNLQSLLRTQHKPEASGGDLHIEGVGNLLTYIARCCQPLPGDAVIGYITMGRGVSIHRQDCSNILHAGEHQRKRFIQVSWGSKTQDHYVADVVIKAFDRGGLLRDVTSLLSHEKAKVFELQTSIDKNDNIAWIRLTIEVNGLQNLSRLLSKIEQIPNVLEARRQV
ncbi:MAG: GTP diphosphokinase [Legionellaceae bacterium]|nr:GTP diphosphokinase [Legionellaceae bacterium]